MHQTRKRFFVLRSYGVLEYGLLEVVPVGRTAPRMSLRRDGNSENWTVQAASRHDVDRWIQACRIVLVAGDLAGPQTRPEKSTKWCKI